MAKGISFFSKLASSVANATFFIKNADFDEIISRVILSNIDEPLSGVQINNLQRYVNELGETSGITEADLNRLVYATNFILTDTENQKESLEAFDVAVKANIDQISLNLIQIVNNTKVVNAEALLSGGAQIAFSASKMNQEFRVKGNGGAVVLNAILGSSQPPDGAKIKIVGHDAVDTVRINENLVQFGQKMYGDIILGLYDSIEYTYNAELEILIEDGRNL